MSMKPLTHAGGWRRQAFGQRHADVACAQQRKYVPFGAVAIPGRPVAGRGDACSFPDQRVM
jgi:hypothetical protein